MPNAREQLMKSALSLFVSQGIDGTSIREIARQTDYSNAALFKHFESKEALAIALFEQCYDRLAVAVSSPISVPDYSVQLNALILRYLKFIETDLEAALYVQEYLRRYWSKLPKKSTRISLLGHMRSVILEGIKQGQVHPKKSPQLLVAALMGFLGQFARMTYFGEFSGRAPDYAE